jgi:hypothetical protein
MKRKKNKLSAILDETNEKFVSVREPTPPINTKTQKISDNKCVKLLNFNFESIKPKNCKKETYPLISGCDNVFCKRFIKNLHN